MLGYFVDSGAISILYCRLSIILGDTIKIFTSFMKPLFLKRRSFVLGEETFHISNYLKDWRLLFMCAKR